MDTVKAEFGIRTQDKRVAEIGKSVVYTPKVRWNGKGIKWFDDSQLIKKKSEK